MRAFYCGKGSSLLTVSLLILLSLGALLLSDCSANEGVSNTSEETTTAANTSAYWKYVALGDSLAVGTGTTNKGYVDQYTGYLETDTGAKVNLINLGRNGQTSSELLYFLRHDSSSRQSLSTANVITFNIGINDLGHASETYENGTCGGTDNQQCLHAAVEMFEENWASIISEILNLRSTTDTIIRTAGIGYTPYVLSDETADTAPSNSRLSDLQVFKPYVKEINRYIAATATENSIPYVEVSLDVGEISSDGVHPNEEGYKVIAEKLRELGYSPLGQAKA